MQNLDSNGSTETALEPDLDLGTLPDLIGYVVRRAQISIFQDFYRTLTPLDLRPAEFSVVLVVGRNPAVRQRRVGEALGIQASNLAVLIDRLVERRLMERRPNPADRRTVALHLTQQGEALLSEANRLVAQHDRRVVEQFSEADHARLLEWLRGIARSPGQYVSE